MHVLADFMCKYRSPSEFEKHPGRKVTQLAYLQHFEYLPFLQGVMLAGSRVWRGMLALAHAHAVQILTCEQHLTVHWRRSSSAESSEGRGESIPT